MKTLSEAAKDMLAINEGQNVGDVTTDFGRVAVIRFNSPDGAMVQLSLPRNLHYVNMSKKDADNLIRILNKAFS